MLRFCIKLGVTQRDGQVAFKPVLDALINKNYERKGVPIGSDLGGGGEGGSPGGSSPGGSPPLWSSSSQTEPSSASTFAEQSTVSAPDRAYFGREEDAAEGALRTLVSRR